MKRFVAAIALAALAVEANAFFRVAEIDGRDWAVDSEGRCTWLAGVDHVRAGGWRCEALGYSPYGRFVETNYASRAEWADETVARLKEWGFNMLSFAHDREVRHAGLAHALGVAFSDEFGRRGGDWTISPGTAKTPGVAFPNVFHPDFAEACVEIARRKCAPHKDDPWLVGWFLDNELAWWGVARKALDTGLFDRIAALPPQHSARKALSAFLRERGMYTNSQCPQLSTNINANSGNPVKNGLGTTSLCDNSASLRLCVENVSASAKREFLALVAERYFAATAAAVRAADPNHLVLGCRFAGFSGAADVVWQAAGRHCDVVSVNVYPWVELGSGAVLDRRGGVPLADRLAERRALAGRPLFVSEWSFSALDAGRPCSAGAGERFRTQRERADAAALALRAMIAAPGVVGASWFMWVDEPALGVAPYFPEDCNYGLVGEDGRPYGDLVGALSAVLAGGTYHVSADATTGASSPHRAGGTHSVADGGVRPDGSWSISNGCADISGRGGDGAPLASAVAFGGRVVGSCGALLEWSDGGRRAWTEATNDVLASVSRDAGGGVSATVSGECRSGAMRARIAVRFSLAPGRGDALAEIVSLENLGDAPLVVRGLFLRPFASGGGIRPGFHARNLYGEPDRAAWLLSDGSEYALETSDDSLSGLRFWIDGAGTQHPDACFAPDRPLTLSPGETWTPAAPMSARLAFGPAR